MNNLKNYTNEIFDIAGANGVDTGVGMDMFLANIRNYPDKRLPFCEGANDVDWNALKQDLADLESSKTEFSTFVRENYDEIVALRKAGKFDAVLQLADKWEAKNKN